MLADLKIEHDGRARTYLVYRPSRADDQAPLPVVLDFHGGGGSARAHHDWASLDGLAEREGFIAVYPDGSGPIGRRLLTWNAGACCGYAAKRRVDDVGFVAALLDDLARRAPVDATRVYATGMSNGAMMAYRLAAELPERIAAIAPVAGGFMVEPFAPKAPMAILHFHSVDDPRALYAGGLGPPFPIFGGRVHHPSVEAVLARWRAFEGCPETSDVGPTIRGRPGTPSAGHTAVRSTWGPCRDGTEVALVKLTGAGHVWPGSRREHEALLGPATQVVDASEEMWRFFSRFRARPTQPRP